MSGKPKEKHNQYDGTSPNFVFAKMEEWGARAGLSVIVLAMVLYISGWLSPYIPRERLAENWGLSAGEFSHSVELPLGWDWLPYIWHSDLLGLTGLVLLCGGSIGAYLAILPVFIRQRDIIYAVLVVLQLGVFVLAAGGWLTAH